MVTKHSIRRFRRIGLSCVLVLWLGALSLGCDLFDDESREPLGIEAIGCHVLAASQGPLQDGAFFPANIPSVDGFFQQHGLLLSATFGVSPGGWYNLERNAYATSVRYDFHPSGSIVFGLPMMEAEVSRDPSGATVVAIMAHEFGHILQFQRGGLPSSGKQPELHADFLAGWYLAGLGMYVMADLSNTLDIFFRIGDFQYNSPQHHGTPNERLAAATAGFVSYGTTALNVNDAYVIALTHVGI